jgi:high-affinity iron transporter
MPAWRDQPPDQLAALAGVVQSFSMATASAEPSAAQLATGRAVYDNNCAECHGAQGRGDGFAADEFPVAPTDFGGERPDLAESVRVIASGVDGTSMAPWTDRLSADEIVAVSHYLRQFFAGTGAAPEDGP